MAHWLISSRLLYKHVAIHECQWVASQQSEKYSCQQWKEESKPTALGDKQEVEWKVEMDRSRWGKNLAVLWQDRISNALLHLQATCETWKTKVRLCCRGIHTWSWKRSSSMNYLHHIQIISALSLLLKILKKRMVLACWRAWRKNEIKWQGFSNRHMCWPRSVDLSCNASEYIQRLWPMRKWKGWVKGGWLLNKLDSRPRLQWVLELIHSVTKPT